MSIGLALFMGFAAIAGVCFCALLIAEVFEEFRP